MRPECFWIVEVYNLVVGRESVIVARCRQRATMTGAQETSLCRSATAMASARFETSSLCRILLT
jgi:hypothetical protein